MRPSGDIKDRPSHQLRTYGVGKLLISLLILGSLLGFDPALADGQVREVQRELRKRHLFFGAEDGEPSPALTVAIKRYQEKKGFPPTGVLDPDTLASLGFSQRPSPPRGEVIVITQQERELRGPNGELLPSSFPLNAAPPENTFALESQAEPAPETTGPGLGVRQQPLVKSKRRPPSTPRVRPRKETHPIVLAYRTVDRAMRNLFGPPPSARKKALARRL